MISELCDGSFLQERGAALRQSSRGYLGTAPETATDSIQAVFGIEKREPCVPLALLFGGKYVARFGTEARVG